MGELNRQMEQAHKVLGEQQARLAELYASIKK